MSRRGHRRIRYRVGVGRRVVSLAELLVVTAVLTALAAGLLSAAVVGISLALHSVGG